MAKTVYSIDLLKKLNVFALRTIPKGHKYEVLANFLHSEQRNNLSMIVKRQHIPLYLKDKYGDATYEPRKPRDRNDRNDRNDRKGQSIRRGNSCRDKRLSKADNSRDSKDSGEEIRQILSRLSSSNKEKLFKKFMDCKITDECGPKIIENIYSFALDCKMQRDIYAEIILLLKSKNELIYNQLLQKIKDTARSPLKFEKDEEDGKAKRWWIGNMSLIAEIYHLNPEEYPLEQIYELINFLLNKRDTSHDYLEVACELAKKVFPSLYENGFELDDMIEVLEDIISDKSYETRHRFIVEELVDIYDELAVEP